MKLVDFLEQFTPRHLDITSVEMWDRLMESHDIIPCESKSNGISLLTDLFNLIKAGAFEDHPKLQKPRDSDAVRFNNFETIPNPWKPSKIVRVHQEQMRRKYGDDDETD